MVTVEAPAKVNIHLDIVGRRSDGYHDLSSIFVKLTLVDHLQIHFTASDDFTLVYTQSVPWPVHEDLLYKTYQLYRLKLQKPLGLYINIEKNIPYQAGLGGGSSDAASLLKLLHQHYPCMSDEELFACGLSLGADVPFFLYSANSAYVQGVGDRIESWPEKEYTVVLLQPTVAISTKEAFAQLNYDALLPTVSKEKLFKNWQEGKWSYHNQFADSLKDKYPYIQQYKNALYQNGAFFAELSGTGSVVAGYFFHEKVALQAYKVLKPQVAWACCTTTLQKTEDHS